ncbi:MAG: copper oxidase [Anaerolineae bacterium]|nr:copper oxidase [Phycisphaerae bacterium]
MNNAKYNRQLTRRHALISGAAALASAPALLSAAQADPAAVVTTRPADPGEPTRDYTPIHVPNGEVLPWKVVDGVKVFHLIAEEFEQEMAPGLRVKLWGYNGRSPGPVIETVEGDRVRFYVTNRLPAPTTIHWHGVILPSGMDGVTGLNQKPIEPGETFKYEFTCQQNGTFMYHSHFDEMTQMALGMVGMFIMHARNVPREKRPMRDFVLMSQEWHIEVGAARPDPNEMTDFNVLSFNGKAFPGTAPLVARLGDRVRIRLGNLGPMSHHPIHLHGYHFAITETAGGPIPESARWRDSTVLVPVGSTRTIEFLADNPGDWALHCHMTHHAMNQMGHGIPNMIGVNTDGLDSRVRQLLPRYMTMGETGMGGMGEHAKHMGIPKNSIPMLGAPGPFSYIDMGGMFTILKVRQDVTGFDDPGWYENPQGMVAISATSEDLARDGVSHNGSSR